MCGSGAAFTASAALANVLANLEDRAFAGEIPVVNNKDAKCDRRGAIAHTKAADEEEE